MKTQTSQTIYAPLSDVEVSAFTKDSIFFDIETTGFSPVYTDLYMIGCMYHDDTTLYVTQFFAESKNDESDVLLAFFALLENFTTLITFNGIGFDIPYLKSKCNTHNITDSLDSFQYIDLFKIISKAKHLLYLENYKQKTVEAFLGIQRDDKFNGGELIDVYKSYTKVPNDEARKLLFLHNHDDVIGMRDLLCILSYQYLLEGQFAYQGMNEHHYIASDGSSKTELLFSYACSYAIPKPVGKRVDSFYLHGEEKEVQISVPIIENTLKFFYPNFKDYYYLPAEDNAIHKSVASYVDKEFREQAKASNCYTKRSGAFLPQKELVFSPAFYEEYNDKTSYFEYNPSMSLGDQQKYATHLLDFILHSK